MNWRRGASIAVAVAALIGASPAYAHSTFCTDGLTSKPGLRAQLWIMLPEGGAPALEDAAGKFGASDLAMTASSGWMEDPGEKPPLRASHFTLESPDRSVIISIDSSNRTDRAHITVERACHYDTLGAWQPYWTAFTAFLQRQGYRVVSRPRINLRKAGFALNTGPLRAGP